MSLINKEFLNMISLINLPMYAKLQKSPQKKLW